MTRGGYRKGDASQLVKLVRVLRRVPGLSKALEAGFCTVAHVEVLAVFATAARDVALEPFARQLVADACNFPAPEYEALCAHWADLADQNCVEPPGTDGYYLNITPSLFGETDLRGHLTADQSETLCAALRTCNGPDPKDAPVQRTVGQRNADALIDITAHVLNQPSSKGSNSGEKAIARRGSRPTAIVTLDLDTALDQARELGFADMGVQPDLAAIRRQLLSGGALPAEVAELFLCDANVRRMVIDAEGQPLDVGKPVPTITTGQRLALHARDRGCVFPTCDRPAHWCDVHHVHHRADGGSTDVGNLVLLCRHHHRLIHGHRWNLERDPVTGVVSAIRWDGLIYRRASDGVVDIVESAHDPPLRI